MALRWSSWGSSSDCSEPAKAWEGPVTSLIWFLAWVKPGRRGCALERDRFVEWEHERKEATGCTSVYLCIHASHILSLGALLFVKCHLYNKKTADSYHWANQAVAEWWTQEVWWRSDVIFWDAVENAHWEWRRERSILSQCNAEVKTVKLVKPSTWEPWLYLFICISMANTTMTSLSEDTLPIYMTKYFWEWFLGT